MSIESGRAGGGHLRAERALRLPFGAVCSGYALDDFAVHEFRSRDTDALGEQAGVAFWPAIDDRPGLPAGAVRIKREDAPFGDDAARVLPPSFGVAGRLWHHLADFSRGERYGWHDEPAASILFQLFGQQAIVGFAFNLQAQVAPRDEAGEDGEARDPIDLEHERTIAHEQRTE